jgi:hypothetical protein
VCEVFEVCVIDESRTGESSSALHDYLAKMLDFDESFETALASMIRGFAEASSR